MVYYSVVDGGESKERKMSVEARLEAVVEAMRVRRLMREFEESQARLRAEREAMSPEEMLAEVEAWERAEAMEREGL